jgi:two-component system osmolarity sensor histidine kinase EnvZ
MSRLTDGERQAMIDDIERIDAIVGQFVEYARLGTPARSIELDAAAELRALLERYRHPAGTEFAADLSAELPAAARWRGDPVDLRRVVSNLVDNATRHGAGLDGHSTIKVALDRSAQGIRLLVEDEGRGIPPDLHASALRPFSRLDTARSESGVRGGGSGLGLAIVARIARRYAGEVRLASGERGGLRVSVELPDMR